MKPDDFIIRIRKSVEELRAAEPSLDTDSKAFLAWAMNLMYGFSVNETIDSITDGSQDKGIDCIFIPTDYKGTVYIVSAELSDKHESNFREKDIINTFNGVDWLLKGDLDKLDNIQLKSKAEEFREYYYDSFPTIRVIFLTTKQMPTPDGQEEVKKFLDRENRLKETHYVEFITLIDLVNAWTLQHTGTTTEFKDKIELTEEPHIVKHDRYQGVSGTIKASSIVELFRKHGHILFESNLRYFLGNVAINKEITTTAQTNPDMFWCFNNGITILCKSMHLSMGTKSVFEMDTPQVVNGCQTINTLNTAKGVDLDRVMLPVRIIVVQDHVSALSITSCLNQQNAISYIDQVSNNPIIGALAKQAEEVGFFLETMRKEVSTIRKDGNEHKNKYGTGWQRKYITTKELLQSYATYFHQLPSIAKRDTKQLFTPYHMNGYFDTIVSGDSDIHVMISSVLLYRYINYRRRQFESGDIDFINLCDPGMWLVHADYFILGLLGIVRESAPIANIDSFDPTADYADIDKEYNRILERISEAVKEGELATVIRSNPSSFFKSSNGYKSLKAII